jgi:hypothetical protein
LRLLHPCRWTLVSCMVLVLRVLNCLFNSGGDRQRMRTHN